MPVRFFKVRIPRLSFRALGLLCVLLLVAALANPAPAAEDCAEFNALVEKTYNFDEAKLSNQQKLALEKKIDEFWTTVQKHKAEYLPCLREAVQNPKANPFFRFDGSNLLVELDPSVESKKLQVEIYTTADLDLVGARRWMSVMTQRGTEGFDISQAATRWLSDPENGFIIPEHGDFEVGPFEGAIFLFGSMQEEHATPALLKIVNQRDHLEREGALEILTSQATPEAIRALKTLDMTGFSDEHKENVQAFLARPELIEPREKPLVTRAQFLKSFEAIVKGDSKPFFDLVDKVPDGERDAIMVLRAADLPLLRQVRRRFAAGSNQHALSYYQDFTNIILTLIWQQEPA
jgi:hypothetical protein